MLRADPPIPSPGWVNMQLRTPHSSLPRPGPGQSRAPRGGITRAQPPEPPGGITRAQPPAGPGGITRAGRCPAGRPFV